MKQIVGYCISDVGYRYRTSNIDIGHRIYILDVGYRYPDVGYKYLDVGYRYLDVPIYVTPTLKLQYTTRNNTFAAS